MRKSSVVVLMCAAALGACGGGGGSDEAQVVDALNEYVNAFVDKDSGRVCELLSSEAKDQIAEAGASLGGGVCEDVIDTAVGLVEDDDLEGLRDQFDISEDDVTVDGETATVDGASLPGSTGGTQLVKEDGDWLIAPDQ